MVVRNEYTPKRAVHPGEYLNEELKARGIQKKDFAKKLGIHQSNLSGYLKGDRNFTPEFSLKLQNALPSISAEEWMSLQSRYDITKVKIEKQTEDERIATAKEEALNDVINIKELLSRLNVNIFSALGRVSFISDILEKAEIPDILSIEAELNGAYKGSDKLEVDARNQRTWVLLAKIASVAEAKGLPEYNRDKGMTFCRDLSEHINNGTLKEKDIRDIARKNGIGYVRVEKLDKVPVDAYSTWVGENPIIVPTYRHNDMHKLAFDILHEMGHIILHKGMSFISIQDCDYMKQDGKELEANKFAENQLIPEDVWSRIFNAKSSVSNTMNTISRLAKENGINPNIAFARYSKETGYYKIRGLKKQKIF